MREIGDMELEEGEAYIPQHDHDDDEKIDPDKDFSYIDKKIENVLAHYQKDFMGGLCPENLGARYGIYGSFLPMQQRSPPVLSYQRIQSRISSKSPHNKPSERFPPNPTAPANLSLPVRSGSASSDHNAKALPESGICSMNRQSKLQRSHDRSSSDEQKEPTVHRTAQKSLKLRVKISSDSPFSRDNTAIYSGLGLDMSPSSSLKDSPSECVGASPGMQEMKAESPSHIVKMMTSFPLPDKEILSPLHKSLLCLVETENNPETMLLGGAQALSLEGKCEAKKYKISRVKEPSKDRKPKQKEPGKERKSKKKLQVKPMELVKENQEYPLKVVALSANKGEESVTSLVKKVVLSKASADAHSEGIEAPFLTGQAAGLRYLALHDENSDGEDNSDKSLQQVRITRDGAKGKCVVKASHDVAMIDEGNVKALRVKMEKDKNINSVMTKESYTEKTSKVMLRREGANKLPKRQTITKDEVKDVVLNSGFHEEDSVFEKEDGMQKKILKDQQAGHFPVKGIEEMGKHHNVSGKMMDLNVETLKPARKKPHSKATPHSQMEVGVPSEKERPFSLAKKKARVSQTGSTSSAEPPKRNLAVSSSAAENEKALLESSKPYKANRDGKILLREGRKAKGLDVKVIPSKKGKNVSRKETAMGVSDRKMLTLKKSTSKANGFDSNIGYTLEGDLSGGNSVMEKALVGNEPPADTESWVQCEQCDKWRLLPVGIEPEFLPKEWTCSMITWLPGKNSCSVSEDETTNELRALYQVPVLGPPRMTNDRAGTASVHASASGLHVDVLSSGGGGKNFGKTQMNGSRESGIQEHFLVKKDQQCSSELKSSKHQKKLLSKLDAVGSSVDFKPSKLEKKRVTELKASRVPKKAKSVNPRSMEIPGHLGLSADESQTYASIPQQMSSDFKKKSMDSPLTKSVCQKKRKLKDRQESGVSTEELSGDGSLPMNNWATGKSSSTEQRKEKKFKVSNILGREHCREKQSGKVDSSGSKHNQGGSNACSLYVGLRMDHVAFEQDHAESASQRARDDRKSSDKALDLGLSDNRTASSSSKISRKIKAMVTCSSVGSISSSLRIPKSEHLSEPETAKKLESNGESTFSESASYKDGMKDRKSKLSRDSGVLSDAIDQDHSARKLSATRRPDTRVVDKPKLEGLKDAGRKLKCVLHENGSVTSQEKSVKENQDMGSVKGLHFHEKYSEKGKLQWFHGDSEKEPASHPNGLPETEKVYGSSARKVDASSSMKKDIFNWNANTALKEATNLRDSADRLKISGSGFESTGALFQAALKFLHGASLLEPGDGGKYGEMTPTSAYTTTARLCEHCALEYERCYNMASAALAYKCMEVAYMRIIYSNDLAVSRDRVVLEMAVRAAPQVDSPSSSASDIDSLNNQAVGETLKDGPSVLDQRNHVVSAANRPNFVRLMSFTQHVNLAMEASRRSQTAFAAANLVLTQAGNEEVIALVKRVLDFSFHDIDGLLHQMRLAMEALDIKT